jgi:hypothetical protein
MAADTDGSFDNQGFPAWVFGSLRHPRLFLVSKPRTARLIYNQALQTVERAVRNLLDVTVMERGVLAHRAPHRTISGNRDAQSPPWIELSMFGFRNHNNYISCQPVGHLSI